MNVKTKKKGKKSTDKKKKKRKKKEKKGKMGDKMSVYGGGGQIKKKINEIKQQTAKM